MDSPLAPASKRFPPPERRFVPAGLDAGRWEALEPLFRELESRQIGSAADLEAWLIDVSELESRISAEEARRYIDMTRHTDDDVRRESYLEFVRDMEPRLKVAFDRLDRLYLESHHRRALPCPRYEVLDRVKECEASIFREENVELEARDSELATGYTRIVGALTVELDGEEVTMARASLELEEPDRERRESVWRKIAERRYRDAAQIESLYADLLDVRAHIAANAGFPSFREFRFRKLRRFDYGVDECIEFHEAVRDVVVPAVSEMNAERRRLLGLDSLRPWDFEVDPFAAAPFRPFDSESELCELARRLFGRIEPQFADDFAELESLDLLDLYSRPNKAPGGYQYFLEDIRLPFIFANAAGTHEDVQTLLHEGGHAFHSLASRQEPLMLYRDPPMEFCEVASMGLEFLAIEHLERVYPEAEARRARRAHLEKTLRLLAWIAVVDAFQHWVYTRRRQGRDERRREWVRLRDAYSPDTDWSGIETYREVEWHRQGHLFRQPFYYIEYGIALLGALQLWSLARNDGGTAVANYRRALALGGSRSLSALFEAAGLRFEFGADLLGGLVGEVFDEWKSLNGAERG